MFVKTYMTRNPISISPDATFPQAISVIRKNRIRHLPVIQAEKLVGIITETDIFKVLVEVLGGQRRGLRMTLGLTQWLRSSGIEIVDLRNSQKHQPTLFGE